MTTKIKLADDESHVEGRSAAKAKELLEKAKLLGLEGRISTTGFGYIVPTAILGEGAAQTEGEGSSEEFDPFTASVNEVKERLANADDIERERVLAAERDGKARKGILADTEGE
jgi:hypothetical protein